MPNLQVASPAVEDGGPDDLAGHGGGGVAGVRRRPSATLSALGFFVALYAAVSQRRRELALLRTLGYPVPLSLFALVDSPRDAGARADRRRGGIALGRGAAAYAAHAARARRRPVVAPPPSRRRRSCRSSPAPLAPRQPTGRASAGLVAYRTQPAAALVGRMTRQRRTAQRRSNAAVVPPEARPRRKASKDRPPPRAAALDRLAALSRSPVMNTTGHAAVLPREFELELGSTSPAWRRRGPYQESNSRIAPRAVLKLSEAGHRGQTRRASALGCPEGSSSRNR